ncbi:MAG TPA: fumarylacetoacetate hydrolase family protein [Chloroflexota bacterium]|jgi:2-keto-4-pentenoate hydratase/2-oxohepta-3-ene-1,7-dioic acid hydratase in catechol pathway|nr:fumarylacetoacetate hydrolase family protein [Chloroflexota bacterium]
MKFVVFQTHAALAEVGLLTDRGVVGLGSLLGEDDSPQAAMERVIDAYDTLLPRLLDLAASGPARPVRDVQLQPPLPRPGKILCSTAVFDGPADRPPLLMTLKSPESVIGPGETIRLPDVDAAWQFVAEAELGLVIRGPGKQVAAADWRQAVFGYTCVVDVMARGDEQFGRDFWLAKAETLGPLGPCIVTADEIPDPGTLRVRSWQNGTPRQDYAIATASYSVGEQVELASTVMTLKTGDVLACGTSRVGLEPLRQGDRLDIEIDRIGRLVLGVSTLAASPL